MGVPGAEVVAFGLDDPRARLPQVAGAKAAALARAGAAGFPVLPGIVIPTSAPSGISASRETWDRLSNEGTKPLVVRSSSPVEDAASSSMAGRFVSVIDVRGWDAFADAVGRVRASAPIADGVVPMAVLVQPSVDAVRGGVLFGLDPVSGDRRRFVVESCEGTPAAVVGGSVTAARAVLSRHGRRLDREEQVGRLTIRDRHRLARLARRAERTFGAPQDIEWAVDRSGRLWMLQSRPVTAVGDAMRPMGPLLGPGPIGETFPEPLSRLERDLFLSPLRIGIIEALRVLGVVPKGRIARSPVVTTVGCRVAADLELLGWAPRRRGLAILNPIPPARHLVAAWRIGRLRLVLPGRSDELVARVDRALANVPALRELDDRGLLLLLGRVRHLLVTVHAHQILAGMLLAGESGVGASAAALSAVAAGRSAAVSDPEIVARAPIVLALVPPAVGPPPPLPDAVPSSGGLPMRLELPPRESLRLRARWLDELAARAAWSLGGRLAASGRIGSPIEIRELTLAELTSVLEGGPVPPDLWERRDEPGPPLPAAFRMTASGTVVAASPRGGRTRRSPSQGRGAGGGRGAGRVTHEGAAVRPGDVLVVRVLSPALAPLLHGLAGLVSETGSELSHLAILAREAGVPTVVGMEDAMALLPEGSDAVVDGTTGEVRVEDRTEASNGLTGEVAG